MFSNVALSLGEDALAIFITWFATSHPVLAAAIVVTFLVMMIVLVRFVLRGFRYLFSRRQRQLHTGTA
jgi:cadmium resistance protein CadD (predicted permease)